MKVYAIQPRQVTFRDDDTYMPPFYDAGHAMTELSEKGYILQGKTTQDAFEKLHDDVNALLKEKATASTGVWHHDWVNGVRYNDKSLKQVVVRWGEKKDEFAGMLTRFWESNKFNKFVNIKQTVANYLTNFEGIQPPSFFEKIFSRHESMKYINKEVDISNVIYLFLKPGKHRLK
jgi:hypothetical protein